MENEEASPLKRQPIVIDNIESSYDRRPRRWEAYTKAAWDNYEWQLNHRLMNAREIQDVMCLLPGEAEAIDQLQSKFPVVITPHMAAMIRPELGADCPIRRQMMPSLEELNHYEWLSEDPLGEWEYGVSPCATRRYPDRVLIYTTSECAMRCRHCTRRSRLNLQRGVSWKEIDDAIRYVESNPQVRDVLISGGDPLCLDSETIDRMLARLRACDHIDVIRLCTRMVCTLPQRFLDRWLIKTLKKYAPIYIHTQFNHPYEASVESANAMKILRSCGCILGNQSVLLKGINDRAEILEPLYRWLLRQGCRPYYLFLCDVAQGTYHFRTSIQAGLDIIKALRGRVSGLAIPHFVVDLPDGKGKVDLCPDSIREGHLGGHLKIRNWYDELVDYEDLP